MRIVAIFTFSFAVAVAAAQYVLPGALWLPVAMACLLLVLFFPLLQGRARHLLPLIGWGLAVGLTYNWCYAQLVSVPAEALAGTERLAEMTVCDYPAATDYGTKMTVRLDCLPHGKAVYYGGEELLDLVPGQTITDVVRLSSASRIREDDITNFTSRGIFLLAYRGGEAEVGEGSRGSPRWWPIRLGHAMAERTEHLLEGDAGAFLAAILTGDKSRLSEQASIDLSEAGVYHILAVSGMHCVFLLGLLEELLGRHRRRLLAAAGIPVLLFYTLLAGCSLSVVRSCVMLIFLLLAPLTGRDRDGPTALAGALLLILLQNPYSIASISLQLSFAAVAGLLWLTPRLHLGLLGEKKRGQVSRFLVGSLSASCGALVFTIPLSGCYFNNLVLVSPLANLLCIWVAGIIFGAGLMAVLLSWLWLPLGQLLALIPGLLIRYVLGVSHLLARLPSHALYFDNPYLWCWLFFAYVLLAIVFRKGRRTVLLAGCCAALTLTATVWLGAQTLTAGTMDITVLDVGQGSAVLVESDGTAVLIDCGSGNSWYSAGEIAADRLATVGCYQLDYLVLTHFDSDHVNGLTALLARMPVEKLLVPESGEGQDPLAAAAAAGTEVRTVTEQTAFPVGRAEVMVLPPVNTGESNEAGLTALAALDGFELLVTGDMDAATERKLLEAYPLPDVEVLIAGHHGSATSTSQDLLNVVKPERVIVSVGSNSYGHPTPEVLLRLQQSGAEVYRTDLQGSVHLSVN